MSHFDPLGCLLSVSLTNLKIATSRIIEISQNNRFDDKIEDDDFLIKVGRMLEGLSNYKEILPLTRALIPKGHQLFGISVYKDGLLSCESSVS